MTPELIKRKLQQIRFREDQLGRQLKKLQLQCHHPNVKEKARSNTGNYDPSLDRYWYEYHCPDCDKRWTTSQS